PRCPCSSISLSRNESDSRLAASQGEETNMINDVTVSRRQFLSIAGIGAASAFLASCGVSGGDAKQAEKALRACFAQPITDLDPLSATTTVDEPALMARRLIFDTLVRRVGDEITPALATSWEQPDEETWVFKIRDDVTF